MAPHTHTHLHIYTQTDMRVHESEALSLQLTNFFHVHNCPPLPHSGEVGRERTDTLFTDKELRPGKSSALLKGKEAIQPRRKPRAPMSQPPILSRFMAAGDSSSLEGG